MSLRKVTLASILIATTVALSACSKKTTEQYIMDAQAYLANEEPERAVIELKSAILEESDNLNSRLLLGQIYYQLSQFANAEKEFETAKDLSAAEDDYFLPLLRSQYYQNNFAEAQLTAESYTGSNPDVISQATLYSYLANTRLDSLPPPFPKGLEGNSLAIAQANQALMQRRPTQTINLTESLTANSPSEQVEINTIRGIALLALNRQEQAKAVFQQVVDIFPYYYFARFQLIEVQTDLNLLAEAEENLAFLFEIKPDSALTHYYSALVNFKQDNFKQAFQSASIASSGNINDIELNFIAGVSAYKIGKIESAYSFLSKNKNKVPSNHLSNKILAELSLKLGYALDVVAELGKLNLKPSNQAKVLSSAAINQFQLGNFAQANSLIGQARDASPEDSVVLLREGLMKLSTDDLSGLDSLAESIKYDPSIDESWLLLAEAFLREGEHDAAIALAQKWQQRNTIDGLNLEGYLRLKMGETSQAIEIFERILSEEPEHSGAIRYLMLTYAQQQKFDQAKIYADQLVQLTPDSLQNLVSYVNLHLGSGQAEVAEDFLIELSAKHPDNQETVVAYAMLLSWKKDYQRAIDVLNEKGDPNNDLVQRTKGDLYKFIGDYENAEQEYDALLKKDLRNPEAWFRKIQLVKDQGIVKKGLSTVKNALKHFPNDPRLIGLHAHFLTRDNKIAEAKSVMRDLEGFEDKLPIVHFYNGHIAVEEGRYEDAYHLLQSFYKVDPNFETATQLARALEGLGKPEQGLVLLKREIAKLHKPFIQRHRIAEYMVNNNMYDQALPYYDKLLKNFPLDIVTVNNYAALLTKTGELDKAEELAKINLKLQPTSPYAMDTLGRVYFKQGKIKEALFYVEKAYEAFPRNAEITLHLVDALLADNQTARAKRLIKKVKPITKIEQALLADIQAKL